MPPNGHLKLTSVKHVRRLLATTINKLLNNEISSQIAQSVATLASVLLKTLQMSNFEERLDKLEKALEIEPESPKPTSDIRSMISDIKEKANK